MVSDEINNNHIEIDASLNNRSINNNNGQRQRVCIVGVGAAGLCALRHLNMRSDCFELTAFEQDDNIGGTWKFTEHVGMTPDGLPVHSSMYKNLHTNLPMEIMGFPDFPLETNHSYVHHSVVLNYLHKYAETFNLHRFIHFNHRIMFICRENDEWLVTAKDIKKRYEFTQSFDVILICTGRYSVPHWPKYDTMKKFKGKLLHSHDYRQPEDYIGQRIAVIGGGLSGVDISQECSHHCKEVIFVNNGKMRFQNMFPNVQQVDVKVEEFTENSIIARDNDGNRIEYQVDTIIMATGYVYNLKFVDPNVGIKANPDGTIDGLYRHLINIEQPSMALFAVSNRVLPLPLYHQQLLYLMKILLGEYKLPTKKAMILDTEEDYRQRLARGLRPKDRHTLEVEMMEKYVDKLAKESQTKPLLKVIINLHRDLYSVRKMDISNYKRFDYRLISDDEYIAIDKHTGMLAYTSRQGFLDWYYKHHPIGSKMNQIETEKTTANQSNSMVESNGHP
ncbi:dimethylaniline monooxygenase [Dermatophagoides farinae]|uniref:Flavin-containing monooxygenase n=1 Tax=Dermatophagoides farinae TaxID=6954 RepID=A0A9D4P3N8_DERFA|nr:senecionine N-oxygenase-like [Dermatophagoides farinae]KAH7643799.1 dimethylaniline monooxygenase [Dermatophagoides farinae]